MTDGRYTDTEVDLRGRRVPAEEWAKLQTRTFRIAETDADVFPVSWEIAARVVQTTLERGGELTVQIYLTGFGVPQWAKLTYYPPRGLLGASTSGQSAAEVEVRLAFRSATYTHQEPGRPAEKYHVAVAEEVIVNSPPDGGYFDIPVPYFHPRAAPGPSATSPEEALARRTLKVVLAELDEVPHAPIEIRSHIHDDAPSGDHSIPFVLTYKDTGGIHTSRFDLSLHVQQFWETRWFQGLGAAATVVVVVASIYSALK